jgi:hypothetical protein
MKNLLIVVILVLGMFCGFIYYKTGNIPVRDWSEQLASDGVMGTLKKISSGQFVAQAKKMANEVTAEIVAAPTAASVQIYKWTDAKGVVHYDNQPVKGAQELSINPNANVMPMDAAPDIGINEKPPVDEAKQAAENVQKMRAAMEARAGI